MAQVGAGFINLSDFPPVDSYLRVTTLGMFWYVRA